MFRQACGREADPDTAVTKTTPIRFINDGIKIMFFIFVIKAIKKRKKQHHTWWHILFIYCTYVSFPVVFHGLKGTFNFI